MTIANCKAIYFDMGGVLMSVIPEYNRENAIKAAVSGPYVSEFLGPEFEIQHFLEFMAEEIQKRGMVEPGIQEDAWRVDRKMLQDFSGKEVPFEVLREKFWNQITYMTSCFEPVEGIVCMLETIKTRGLICGLISNVFHPAIIFKELFTQWGIIDYFDPLLFSSEYRFKKPHRAIFDYALSWHPDLKPDETVYIGDTWDIDVVGARGAGMIPVWVNGDYTETHRDGVRVISEVTKITDLL